MLQRLFFLIFLAGLGLGLEAGPIRELYVVEWQNAGVSVIQGNSVVRHWATAASQEIGIAVNTTVKTMGYVNGSTGAEYSLSGTFLGTTYTKTNASGSYVHDGTTDGTYNYTVDYSGGAVYRFDSNWANPTAIFSTGYNHEVGITYDRTNDSFWISSWSYGTIRNYSRAGALLSTISTGFSYVNALALDHADGTLWVSNQATNNFYQFSKTGTLLSTAVISGITGSVWGAEFAYNAVPEPSTFVLLSFMGLVLFYRWKKS